MTNIEMEKKIKRMRELQAFISEASSEVDGIKDAIKAEMGDAEEMNIGEYKITWKPVTTSRLDTAALKRDMPGLVERYSSPSTVRRFCVA